MVKVDGPNLRDACSAVIPACSAAFNCFAGEHADLEVRLVRGDTLLQDRRVDFVKIDVEGMEMKALAGLAGTIDKWRPAIFIEVDDSNSGLFRDWVSQHSYTVVRTYRRYEVNENYMVLPCEAQVAQ